MARPQPTRPRLPDWPERLAALVESRRETAFEWGSHDCCLFAADAVLAITGADPAAAWRGAYADEAGALALIDPTGLEATVMAAAAAFGASECAPALAQRGDLVLLLSGNQPTMGVVLGDRAAAPGPDGLAMLPLRLAQRAWAV